MHTLAYLHLVLLASMGRSPATERTTVLEGARLTLPAEACIYYTLAVFWLSILFQKITYFLQ